MAYSTISKPSLHFNTKLYTGTGSSNSVTGVGFQPDMTWFKHRSGASEHNIYDAVRGATKRIIPNDNSAEGTQSNGLTAFGSDGFTVANSNATNLNNGTYASWNWKANGAGSANTDGTISSTVSANTTSGFSIVKWTGNGSAGATIGHGLGSTPSAIFVKGLSALSNWSSYHSVLGNTGYMRLDGTGAFTTASTYWNNTSPDNDVFTVGTTGNINGSGNDYIAYCFRDVVGYSKHGSYVGNGNADGTFVYTGFKPAFVIFKNTTDAGYGWYILDNKRDPDNVAEKYIFANQSSAEGTNAFYDLLSNGFKVRESGGGSNGSGKTYIYMAFASAPLVGTNNVPCTAR